MPTLTLEGLPDEVYRVLKERAAINRRSLNSEMIHRLERSVVAEPVGVTKVLADAAEIRARIQARLDALGLAPPTAEEITAAKHEGRP